MGQGPFERSWMDRGSLPGVRVGSGDSPRGPGRIGGLSRRSRTGRGILAEVQDRSGAFPEVRDGSEDPFGGLGWLRGPPKGPGRVGGPTPRLGRVGGTM